MNLINWEALLTNFTATATITAAVAFLIKSLLTTWMSQGLEQFKVELQRDSLKHSIMFSSLHAKRLELVADLYKQVNAIHEAEIQLTYELEYRSTRITSFENFRTTDPDSWTMPIEGIHTLSDNEKTKLAELNILCKGFIGSFSPNKIYFSIELVKLLEKFTNTVRSAATFYEHVIQNNLNEADYKSFSFVFGQLRTSIPELENLIDFEFRKLLGVIEQ